MISQKCRLPSTSKDCVNRLRGTPVTSPSDTGSSSTGLCGPASPCPEAQNHFLEIGYAWLFFIKVSNMLEYSRDFHKLLTMTYILYHVPNVMMQTYAYN